jgi:hypothetical protein
VFVEIGEIDAAEMFGEGDAHEIIPFFLSRD